MSVRSSLFLIFALSATAAFAADPAPTSGPAAPAPAQSPAQQGLPPGHPPIDQMAMPEPNHAGLVEEVIPAKPYVYLRVKEGKEDQWLAAPEIDVKAGAQVRWADGMLMNNFQSKTLNRTFEKVLFVMKVEPVAAK